MFLSKLTLDLKSRTVQRDLADCQSLHRRIMTAFPQAPAGANAREHFGVLYRLDVDRATGAAKHLVQSGVRPDWTHILRASADYLAAPPETKDIKPAFAAITPGQVLSFRLRANVTRRVAKESKRGDPEFREEWRGKRVEVWGEERQLEWLARKGATAGFEIVTARVNGDRTYPAAQANPSGKVWGRKKAASPNGSEETPRMVFGGVTFEGLLRVEDPGKLRDAITAGIGTGKAYGFGLLSVAPPR